MTILEQPVATLPVRPADRVSSLPVLRQTIAAEGDADCRLVLITHVLDTAVPFVRMLAEHAGLAAVVAVPYSVSDAALEVLTSVPVHVPATIGAVGELAATIALDAASDGGDPVVLQEVGGYCAGWANRLAELPGIRGVVEDTKQGQWRYEELGALPLPVFTIADSPLKALEDVQVGRAVATSVERLLRRHFYTMLAERRVLVLGYGGIGTALAEHVRRTGARVAVYDPDEIRMSAAVVHGHAVGERKALLSWADMIIGVSGHRSLEATDAEYLRDGVVLASGSSKQVEFDMPGLRAAASESAGEKEFESHSIAGRVVHILNEGKPVNFLEQSILGGILDLVYSELYLCTKNLADRRYLPGLHRAAPAQQQQLARRWREHYGHGLI